MSDNYEGDVLVELMGEQLRGGQPQAVVGDDLGRSYVLLGEAVAARNPQALAVAQRRVAASRAVVQHKPMAEAYDYTIDFGPASGAAATTCTLSFIPQMHFRAEKVMCTDTGSISGLNGTTSQAGYGTQINSIFIGADFQKAANTGGTLTAFYAQNALGNGVKWRTCKAALTMSVTVSYINLCTFYMSVFGKVLR